VTAWQAEFIPDGPRTQANLVRALRFGLVPGHLVQATADDLAALVRAAGTHLGTGFLATPDLLPVLADHGHLDLAYELLFQDTSPAWLTMIDRGATTVWERWDGIDADGGAHESLNHCSKGAVISFLHGHVAGLRRLTPTWRRFRVQPRPHDNLAAVRAEHVTPHGPAAVSWQRPGGVFEVTVTVPPGCTAEVVLPDGTRHEATPGVSYYRG
jgi:alpha-L-rhamnosidase